MRIKELRLKSCHTQFQLAEMLDISQQTISKYENDRLEPDINTLIKIANYFNVTLDYLVERSTLVSPVACDTPASSSEEHILKLYRKLNEHNQEILKERAETMVEMQTTNDQIVQTSREWA